MAVLGTQSSLPSAGFAFPRSYIHHFTFGFGSNAIITQTGSHFYITDGNNPVVHVVCNIYDNFWPWSSNAYSLDFLVRDWWLLIDPSPTPLPLNFNLNWQVKPGTLEGELFLFLPGWTDRYEMSLPAQDQPYWLPP